MVLGNVAAAGLLCWKYTFLIACLNIEFHVQFFVTKFTAASELQFKKPFTYYGQDLVSLKLN